MVQELRWIMLDKQEVMLALEAHSRMKPNFMPKGKVAGWNVIDQTSIKLTMTTSIDQQESLILDGDKLLQPLIRFCLENNIMLPRDGRKSVMVADSHVSLCISLDIDAAFISNNFPARLPKFASTLR